LRAELTSREVGLRQPLTKSLPMLIFNRFGSFRSLLLWVRIGAYAIPSLQFTAEQFRGDILRMDRLAIAGQDGRLKA
jgi:hypothetical protein